MGRTNMHSVFGEAVTRVAARKEGWEREPQLRKTFQPDKPGPSLSPDFTWKKSASNDLEEVKVRRLPFYSKLLSRLSPASARELTRFDAGRGEGSFREIWSRYKTARTCPGRAERTNLLGGVSTPGTHHDNTMERPDLFTPDVDEETEIAEEALLRREILGVELWLQLRRCSARADRR